MNNVTSNSHEKVGEIENGSKKNPFNIVESNSENDENNLQKDGQTSNRRSRNSRIDTSNVSFFDKINKLELNIIY